jgi:acetyl esterase/lipase
MLPLLLAGLLCAGGPAAVAQEAPDLDTLETLAEEWFKAADEDAKRSVEERARAVPPITEKMVEPLRKHLFSLASKHGRRMPRKSAGFYVDSRNKKERQGPFLVKKGKKGGGLLLSLHGGGENSGDGGSAHSIWASASSLGFTVISPEVMKKVSSAWNEELEERMVLDLIDAACRSFKIDTNRICIAGHSMGGDGSWMIGGRNADRFAAAAPLAGSVMPILKPGKLNRIDTPRSDYISLEYGVLPNLMHLPYHIHHSDDDRNEAIHPDDIATETLAKLQERHPGKYVFTYDRVKGNGHALPRRGVKPIQKWMAKQRRDPWQKEVVWETWWRWKKQFYWLWSDGHREAWRYHAKITGPNEVEVTGTTMPWPGRAAPKEMPLTLLLSPKLFELDKPIKITSAGKTIHEGPLQRSFWAMLVSIGRRNDPNLWFEGHVDVTLKRRLWTDFWSDEKPELR